MSLRSKTYTIKLNPIPWQRARLSGNRFFDAQKEDKLSFGLYLNKQHGFDPIFSNPIHMDVTFYMPIPKSIKKRKSSLYHSTFPDLDNLCKFLMDAIKDVLVIDDKIICSLSAKKMYDKEPRTEIVITEVS